MEPAKHLQRLGRLGRPAYDELEREVAAFAALQGTLAGVQQALLAALRLRDDIGQLEYKVWYFASLWYDQDQRDNQINAKRQQVQILFAKAAQASAWFDPELLAIPLATVRAGWRRTPELAVYRFAIEDLYRQQEHVLDDKGEHLLSLSSRFSTAPNDAYAALSTADVKHPTVRLSNGAEATLTYGQYRAILATNRNQADRAAAFTDVPQALRGHVNTYASLYNGVLQRDWFFAQARGYALDARRGAARQQHPDRRRREPDRRDQGGHRAAAALSPPAQAGARRSTTYHSYDTTIPLVDFDRKYPYDDVLEWLPASVAPLGADYQRQMREVLDGQCIDVYENPGKRSGAYSAPVYGVHPTCCSTTTTRWTRCSRWRTRWATRCTRCCRTRTSRSCMPDTRSSSPKCRRR